MSGFATRFAGWAGLALAIAAGAFLRFDGLGVPSYWLDEVLGQVLVRRAPEIPWWQWITGVHPQHGPLYYALQWLASAVRDDEWGGRFFAALFGVISVSLLWLSARSMRSEWPFVGAVLLAISPLHVYYSREARPYALLVLLVAIVIVAILRRAPLVAGVALLSMLYTSVATAAAVGSIACASFAAAWLERDLRSRRRLAVIALLAVVVLALFPLLYRSTTEEKAGSPFPGLDATLADSIVRGLGVTALGSESAGRTAYAVLALAVIGAVALVRRDRSSGGVVIAMAVLPIAFSLAGLVAQNHFFGIRYVIAALPAYLLLAAHGIATLARQSAGILPAAAPASSRQAVALAIVLGTLAVITAQSLPAARTEAYHKLDWRRIAATIHRYAQPGDVVIMAEPWSGIVLPYYLTRLPEKVRALQLSFVPLAEVAVKESPAAWLVTGGFNTDVAVRAWMCRFPVVLASPVENFRMHYTSRAGGDFLRERATEREWRAIAGAFGSRGMTLQMTPQEELLFGEGWGGAEGSGGESFRWAIGERATVSLPRAGAGDRTIRMQVSPLDHPSLPPQTMRVELNGRPLQTLTLRRGPQTLSLSAPAALWRDGLNTLAFHFGRALAPADFDPVNRDARKLAVAFDWISIGESGAPVLPALAVRLPPLPEKKDPAETRFLPSQLDREAVARLLGRIGRDPSTDWPKLARGETRLEDLLESVAYGTDCMDEATFVRHTFTLLLGRAPGDAEVKTLLDVPRDRLVGRLAKFEEFRANIL